MRDITGEQLESIDAKYLSVCTTGVRVKLLVCSVVVLVLPFLLLLRMMTHPSHTPTVEIHDWASLTRQETLQRELEKVKFYRPVHIGVLTLDELIGGSIQRSTRHYAQEYDTDVPWTAPIDHDAWADGVILLSAVPTARGAALPREPFEMYFGQDIEPSRPVGKIQRPVWSSAAQELRIEDILFAIRTAAEYIGKPWYMDSAAYNVSVTLALLGSAAMMKILFRGIFSRSRLKHAEEIYAMVNDNWEDTAVQTQTIDPDDDYGAAISERYLVFTDRYYALTQAFRDLGKPVRTAWCTGEMADITTWLRDRAVSLEEMKRALLNAANLLNMTSLWRQAWDNEVAPVMRSLDALGDDIEREVCSHHPFVQQNLREQLRRFVAAIERMTVQLGSRSLRPSDALKRLDHIELWATDTERLLNSGALFGGTDDRGSHGFWHRQGQATPRTGDGASGNASILYDPAIAIRPNSGAAMWDYGSVDVGSASSHDARWEMPYSHSRPQWKNTHADDW